MVRRFLAGSVLGLVAIVCAVVMVSSCGQSTTTTTTVPTQNYGTLVGYVYNSSGTALGGATVTAAGTSQATNTQGWFSFSNLPASSEMAVTFSLANYITNRKTVQISVGRQSYLAASLLSASSSQVVTNSTGGSVTIGTTGIATFPANGFVDANGTAVTGNVTVIITPGSFTTSTDADTFPGDFQGVNAGGVTVSFESFGWFNISATDAGGTGVNLATTAAWSLVLPNASTTTPEVTTVPLWYFANGIWNAVTNPATSAQINATFNNSTNTFTASITGGNVSNFPWNIDLQRQSQSFITGKVVDYSGVAVAAAAVQIRSTANNWLVTVYSGSDGTWGPVAIPGNRASTVIAYKGEKRSATTSVAALSPTTYTSTNPYDVPDIVVDSPRILVTMTWGAYPSDLDSHMTIPTAEGGTRYHVYYSDMGSTTNYPFTILDTDDTSSYGPEHTTVYRLYEGTYRFCVHDYSHRYGGSIISTSEVKIDLNIDDGAGNVATYSFTPPASQPATSSEVWEVCDITVNSSGAITGVTALATYAAAGKAAYNPGGASDNHWTTGTSHTLSLPDKKKQ